MTYAIVLLLAILSVLVYDTVASTLARRMQFNYAWASIGSLLIYLLAGIAAAKASNVEGACLVGAAAGLTDATLGWAISWRIGPGRLPGGKVSLSQWMNTAAFAVVLGTVCAAAGAWLAGHGA